MEFNYDFDALERNANIYINSTVYPLVLFHSEVQKIGSHTHFFKLDALDNYLASGPCAQMGLPLAIVKNVFMLILAYPIASIIRNTSNENIKHLVSALGGIFLLQWLYGNDWIHAFITSIVTYFICLFAPRKYCASLTVFWAMGYITMSHIVNYTQNYLDLINPLDYTGTQMVLTMKLTSYAYNIYDGGDDAVFKKYDENDKSKSLYDNRKTCAIVPSEIPNFLEYLGYIFCFPSLIAGPAFEYNEYIRAVKGDISNKDKVSLDNKKYIPSPFFPALMLFLQSLIFLVLHLNIMKTFPNEVIYGLDVIQSQSMLRRFIGLYINIFGHRCKFYFVWKISEGACILAGLGFEGFDQNGLSKGWSGINNVDVLAFETSPNLRTATKSWNKRTQKWLQNYTYLRTNRSVFCTYFVSAFWHGIYPGYYLFFFPSMLLTEFERLCVEKLNPIFAPGYNESDGKSAYPYVYKIMCSFFTLTFLHYVGQVFVAKTFTRAMVALNSYMHIPFIIFLAAFLILKFAVPKPMRIKSE